MGADNYVSPYGFSPVTDMVIDGIAANHGQEDFADQLDSLSEGERESLEINVDYWWRDYMNLAFDRMEALLSEFIELDPVTD